MIDKPESFQELQQNATEALNAIREALYLNFHITRMVRKAKTNEELTVAEHYTDALAALGEDISLNVGDAYKGLAHRALDELHRAKEAAKT